MENCLFIHGFTGGIFEIEPLAEHMSRNRYACTTFTLHGHGGSRLELKQSSRQHWFNSAEEQLKRLQASGGGIHLIGFSTGALIASRLAVQYQTSVRSLTLLSAPVFPLHPPEILRTLVRPEMLRQYVRKMRQTPPNATREFLRMVGESFEVYPRIEVPTLIVQGARDHLVKPKSVAYLREAIPAASKKVLLAEKSGHMVCHGEDRERVLDEVLQFAAGSER